MNLFRAIRGGAGISGASAAPATPAVLAALVAAVVLAASAVASPPAFRPGGAARGPVPSPLPLYEVDLSVPGSWSKLARLDLDLLTVRPGYRATVLGWPDTERLLRDAGLCVTLLTPDYGAERVRVHRAAGRGGSAGGFRSPAAVEAALDSLAASRPDLVLGLDTLGTTLAGRPIRALGLGSRPSGPGARGRERPEVLVTGLVHGREPAGMEAALALAGGLLAGYEHDPEATALLDRRAIWIVPMVDADGYAANMALLDSTAAYGYWRKNLRDNDGDGVLTVLDGVDLNRNFPPGWGGKEGASPRPPSPLYRGSGPFSEPEARALRDFARRHRFGTAIDLHAFFGACLYPWGPDGPAAPDSVALMRLGRALTEASGYAYGRPRDLLYPLTGDLPDWLYDREEGRPRTFAFTLELGNRNDGFWPGPGRIPALAATGAAAGRVAAWAAGAYLRADTVEVADPPGVLLPGTEARVRVRLRNLGRAEPGAGTVTAAASPLDSLLAVTGSRAEYPAPGPGETAWPEPGREFRLVPSPFAAPGARAAFLVTLSDSAGFLGRDTVRVTVGRPVTERRLRAAEGMDGVVAEGGWGVETVDGTPVFSDSPGREYGAGADARLTLARPVDLSGAVRASVRFRTRWGIEPGYDVARVEASDDGGETWTPLPGERTRAGRGTAGAYAGGRQGAGEPGYDGTEGIWVDERVDLTPYAGEREVWIRFRLLADSGVQGDGWLLDDVRVEGFGGDPVPVPGRGR